MNVNLADTLGPNFTSSKLKSPRNLAIEIVLLVVFSILFYWFIVIPKQASVASQKKDLALLVDQESKMAGALSDLKNLSSSLDNHKSDIDLLDEAMPLANKLNNLQQLIQNLADSVNVSVASINVSSNPGVVVAGDKTLLNNPFGATRKLQVLKGSVDVVGTFSQLESFLQKVENNSRIMDINNLSIDSVTNGNLSMKISLETYFLAPY